MHGWGSALYTVHKEHETFQQLISALSTFGSEVTFRTPFKFALGKRDLPEGYHLKTIHTCTLAREYLCRYSSSTPTL